MGRNESFINRVIKKIYKPDYNSKKNPTSSKYKRETLIPKEYRMEYLQYRSKESKIKLEESRAKLLESMGKSKDNEAKKEFLDAIQTTESIDHDAAKEKLKRQQNKIISTEVKRIIAENAGNYQMSEKWLKDKVIIAYFKENGEKVVKEYTKDELLKRAQQREENIKGE